jgi:hypothetical protein
VGARVNGGCCGGGVVHVTRVSWPGPGLPVNFGAHEERPRARKREKDRDRERKRDRGRKRERERERGARVSRYNGWLRLSSRIYGRSMRLVKPHIGRAAFPSREDHLSSMAIGNNARMPTLALVKRA